MMDAIILDFISGYVVGSVTVWHIGMWGALVGLLCGILWVLGGRGWLGTNSWRRIGVPLIVFLVMKWHNPSGWPYLGALVMYGALSIGYGVPDFGDKGSWLGRTFRYPRVIWYAILAVAMVPLFL